MQILIETCLSLSIENTDSDYSQSDEIHFHKMHFKLPQYIVFLWTCNGKQQKLVCKNRKLEKFYGRIGQ